MSAKSESKKPNTLAIDVEVFDGDELETVELRFKPISVVPAGVMRANRHDDEERMWRVFEWVLDEDGLAILDRIPANKLMDTLTAMQKASGIDLGE